MTARHRGGRRSWRRRVPGVLVAVLAAASAAGVVAAALRGTATDTTAGGAAGTALTLSGGGIAAAKRHRGHHRVLSANPPPMSVTTDLQLTPSVVAAMSAPPMPAVPLSVPLALPALASGPGSAFLQPAAADPMRVPSLFIVPALPAEPDDAPDPMVDTVPHPVVKLFPLASLEPDRAGGSIDDRVYAAFDAERRHLQAAALAGGKHASERPTDAAAPRNASYKSRHSA